jgi:hypothetical protein
MFLYKTVVCEKYGLHWYFIKAKLLQIVFIKPVGETVDGLLSGVAC